MSALKDILLEFIGVWNSQNKIYSIQCTVKSVDIDKRICVCTPTDGGADILNVRLEADITVDSEDTPINSVSKGFFIVPTIGSLVGVSFYSKTEAFINIWTEIDDIIIKSTNFVCEQDLFKFNDGSYGGLIKLSDLVGRLNEYESILSQLKTDFSTWTPAPNDGGLALKTILLSGFLTKTIPSSTVNDFENDKIVHG